MRTDDPMYKPAKTKDYLKAFLALAGTALVLHCGGYRLNAQELEPTYAPLTQTCPNKKAAKKYKKGLEELTDQQLTWYVATTHALQETHMNNDGEMDVFEMYSHPNMRPCDPTRWREKYTYVRLHLTGEPDKLIDFIGGLTTGVRTLRTKDKREITLTGTEYDGTPFERRFEY